MNQQVHLNGMQSYFIEFGQRKVFVSEAGEGFPLLMLHGGGAGATGRSNYSKNIEALSQHFRVIVPDMQGYGQSSKGVKRSDPFGDLAEVMLGLLDQLKIDKAHIVGNSLGGACALRMALEAPERVTGLVLMGPGGINTTRGLPTKGLNQLLNYYTGEGPTREKLRTFIREYLVYDGSQVSEDLIELRYQASIDPEVVASPPLQRPNSLKAAIRMDFSRDPRLKRCNIPTLVLWGSNDKVNKPSGGETLRQTMKHCDLYYFAQTGHWVQWERAEQFNAVTASFLAVHTPAQTTS
ncbi:2-hydroxy-6-ketonona-2,4-dienedioic acid hydrolase [Acinetobacter sp. ANC 5054]|uniref:alpha/beta fold hydrolase n=1 Tax=Acinetobacter sp. ANC 5054 TaxID=1977877 RepID=UPI000A32CE3D|nr:alpha/beta fold hydrolase [Acinetobacter sp. ANC 5054]OTG79678.1 2-hydroxy-6-ketonona-2,4-dienedioic acid hydrolase [Acinetobacter sp. ANC 5054]